jgi:amino acid transporter
VDEQSKSELAFKTFPGVFRPVLLTILGAMLYLRLGWLVGNAGLLGSIGVILAAYIITGTTVLSVSSIASNVRVRPGGAFAIIAGAMGLEAGGAIGIPLFIAQSSSTALYLYAFSEAWAFVFPSHNSMLVAAIAFLLVSFLAYRSASLAFRAQGVMLVLVILALLSAFLGLFTEPVLQGPTWVGDFSNASLLQSFAIFFPASTGIMIGVGMSGSLAKPRTAIPLGTLWAWGVTLVVYLLGAVWYSAVAIPTDLVADSTISIERSALGFLVLLGLLVSTLMAALSSLVAAPRLLQAMAVQEVVPGSKWLVVTERGGNPRNALFVTMGVAALALCTGSLNAVAPIITSFFIITYLAINLVVLLEQRLGMISFRPTFQVRKSVPLLGVVSCALAMVLANPRGGILEFILVIGIYGFLMGRKLNTPWETVHSGIALALADWATQRVSRLERSKRAWKPDMVVPVHDPDEVHFDLPMIRALTARNGTIKLVGLGDHPELEECLHQMDKVLHASKIFTTSARVRASNWSVGLQHSIEVLKGSAFPPNMVLVSGRDRTGEEVHRLLELCEAHSLGVAFYLGAPVEVSTLAKVKINVWLSDRSPEWNMSLRLVNIDLPVLLGVLLVNGGSGRMRLITVIDDAAEKPKARRFLKDLVDMGRLPLGTSVQVCQGSFMEQLQNAPSADITLFGITPAVRLERMKEMQLAAGGLCLFLMDSGCESALV